MNDDDLVVLTKQLGLPLKYMQNLPLKQVSALKALVKEPPMLLWNCVATISEIRQLLIDNKISLSAKDVSYTVLSSILIQNHIVKNSFNNDSINILNATSRVPETNLVDMVLFLSLWNYVLLIKQNALQRNNNSGPISGQTRTQQDAYFSAPSEIIESIEKETKHSLHCVLMSSLLYRYIKEYVFPHDGRYLPEQNFIDLLTTCRVSLTSDTYKLLKKTLIKYDIYVFDNEYYVDMVLLIRIMHYCMYRKHPGNDVGVILEPPVVEHQSTHSPRNVHLVEIVESIYKYWSIIEKSIQRVMFHTYTQMIRGKGDTSAQEHEMTPSPEMEHKLSSMRIISCDLLYIAINHSSLPIIKEDVVMLWQYMVDRVHVPTPSHDSPSMSDNTSYDLVRMCLLDIKQFIMDYCELHDITYSNTGKASIAENDPHARFRTSDQIDQSHLSNLMRDKPLPPSRGVGCPHPDSIQLNKWEKHVPSDINHCELPADNMIAHNGLINSHSNIYMKISNFLNSLSEHGTNGHGGGSYGNIECREFIHCLCTFKDCCVMNNSIVITRGSIVDALQRVGLMINKYEADQFWMELLTYKKLMNNQKRNSVAGSDKNAIYVTVIDFIEILSFPVSIDMVHAEIETSLRYFENMQEKSQKKLNSNLKYQGGISSSKNNPLANNENHPSPVRSALRPQAFEEIPTIEQSEQLYNNAFSYKHLSNQNSLTDEQACADGNSETESAKAYDTPNPHDHYGNKGASHALSPSEPVLESEVEPLTDPDRERFHAPNRNQVDHTRYVEAQKSYQQSKESLIKNTSHSHRSNIGLCDDSDPSNGNASMCDGESVYSRGSRGYSSSKNMSDILCGDRYQPDSNAREIDHAGQQLGMGSKLDMECASSSSIVSGTSTKDTQRYTSGSHMKHLLGPAVMDEREMSIASSRRYCDDDEVETGSESILTDARFEADAKRDKLVGLLYKNKTALASVFRRLGSLQQAPAADSTTSHRAQQYGFKLIDFVHVLLSPPLTFPMSQAEGWKFVCDVMSVPYDSDPAHVVTYGDIIEFLNEYPADGQNDAAGRGGRDKSLVRHTLVKNTMSDVGGYTEVISKDPWREPHSNAFGEYTDGDPAECNSISIQQSITNKLNSSSYIQKDRLKLLSSTHILRKRLRDVDSRSTDKGGGRRQHQESQSAPREFSTDRCTKIEMLELLRMIDIHLTNDEFNYIFQHLDCDCDDDVRIGAFMLYLGNLM